MMHIERSANGVRVRVPAKVNLFLEVVRRRDDGYHDLATLMLAVGLYDTLEFEENSTGGIRLWCDLPGLSTGPDNLVHKAASLVRETFGISAGVDIRLSKRIPTQAGLAGGSADAAATLAGLDRLWRLGQDARTLGSLGARLGSDVTFFFHGPAAWCTGRGEVVETIPCKRPLDLVLLKPAAGLSTPEVFRALKVPAVPRDGMTIREALASGDVARIGAELFNRLEEPAMILCPAVGRLREYLLGRRPAGVLMSGSGTTVFALTESPEAAISLARGCAVVREDDGPLGAYAVRSCDLSVPPSTGEQTWSSPKCVSS